MSCRQPWPANQMIACPVAQHTCPVAACNGPTPCARRSAEASPAWTEHLLPSSGVAGPNDDGLTRYAGWLSGKGSVWAV